MSTNKRRTRPIIDGPNALHWTVGVGGVLAILCVLWIWNSRSFPEVTSGESLRLIKALYTACSSRSDKRLAQVEKELSTIETQGKLTEAERDAFSAIIEDARTGDWQDAAAASYTFAQDQVR